MNALLELSPVQSALLDRLVARGFSVTAFPLYANTIGIRRDSFVALLTPVEGGGLRVFGEPCYLIDGHLSVRIHRDGRLWFVWKAQSREATPELLSQLSRFSEELLDLLTGW